MTVTYMIGAFRVQPHLGVIVMEKLGIWGSCQSIYDQHAYAYASVITCGNSSLTSAHNQSYFRCTSNRSNSNVLVPSSELPESEQ